MKIASFLIHWVDWLLSLTGSGGAQLERSPLKRLLGPPGRDGSKFSRTITNDDGLLAKLVENQIVTEEDAFRIDQAVHADQLSDTEYSYFRLRGGITQALGGPLPPGIHVDRTTIRPGDRILLCTDGIHDNL